MTANKKKPGIVIRWLPERKSWYQTAEQLAHRGYDNVSVADDCPFDEGAVDLRSVATVYYRRL